MGLGSVRTIICRSPRAQELLGGNLAEAQLNSLIAIALDSLLLHDGAGACLDDGDGDNLAALIEQLGHTDFLADNAFNNFLFLL